MTPLVTCILQRLGADIDRDRLPQILYEDEDRDKVVLASDDDLMAAVDHARLAGWKACMRARPRPKSFHLAISCSEYYVLFDLIFFAGSEAVLGLLWQHRPEEKPVFQRGNDDGPVEPRRVGIGVQWGGCRRCPGHRPRRNGVSAKSRLAIAVDSKSL